MWTQAEAIELCCKIEVFAPSYGCHVALTGGTLYKTGERKDCDIVFYRIRQSDHIDVEGLMIALRPLGITPNHDHGFCYKVRYQNKAVDFLFPDRPLPERSEYLR